MRTVVRQMGEDGWLGIGWPTEYGGQGRSAIEQFIFFDESMRCGAPVPMLKHRGRIWRAMEDKFPKDGPWGSSFRAFIMSAPIDSDLLNAASWTSSNLLAYDPQWLGKGWLEGNAVADFGTANTGVSLKREM